MANNTFVGFPNGGTGSDTDDSDCVRELQPITSWSRDGNYTVTRRWRGPVTALTSFSNGGSGNKDYGGTYFTGPVTGLLGGAGRDGAISTNLLRDAGGQLGVFTATWVTSDVASALGNPRAAGRTGTTGDQFQESSLWSLDGNDLEKDLFDCPVLASCRIALGTSYAGGGVGPGFPARAKKAIENYKAKKDLNGNDLPTPAHGAFWWVDYLSSTEYSTLIAGSSGPPDTRSILGNSSLLADLDEVADDALKGVSAYRISQYVLRNTKVVNYSSSQIPHYANTNRVWTTAQIKSVMTAETRTIDPPTTLTSFTLPLIGVLGTVLDSSKWLYGTPDVTQLNDGKWQITKQWTEGDEIASSCYRLAV